MLNGTVGGTCRPTDQQTRRGRLTVPRPLYTGLYSPFPQSFSPRRNSVPLSHRTSSCIGLDPPNLPYSASSHIPDSPSSASSAFDLHPSSTSHSIPRLEGFAASRSGSTTPMWGAWEKEADDFLHSYDPELEKVMDKQRSARFSWFALLNTASLIIVVVVLVGLFAGWPIYRCVHPAPFPP